MGSDLTPTFRMSGATRSAIRRGFLNPTKDCHAASQRRCEMPEMCESTATIGAPIRPKNDHGNGVTGELRTCVSVAIGTYWQVGKKLWSCESSMTALTWGLGSTRQKWAFDFWASR